ncbi:hypothetical protein AGLY_000463, partial [Aphis glycines]
MSRQAVHLGLAVQSTALCPISVQRLHMFVLSGPLQECFRVQPRNVYSSASTAIQLSGSRLDDASFVPDDSLDRIRCGRRCHPSTIRRSPTRYSGVDDDGGRHVQHLRCRRVIVALRTVRRSQRAPRAGYASLTRLECKQSCLLLPAVQPVQVAENATATTVVAVPTVGWSPERVPDEDRHPSI